VSRDELSGKTGTVRWEIPSPDPVPERAQQLHEEGRRLGQQGRYDEALKRFEEAQALAPHWPYPTYDTAFTYQLMGEDAKALAAYERVDALEPRGFFSTMTALAALRQEAQGLLPKGTYLQLQRVEWEQDPAKKRKVLEALVKSAPRFAPALKELASLSEDDAERLRLIDKALTLEPDAETRGNLQLNRATLLYQQGKRDEARALLLQLRDDPASTMATATLARETLALFESR
jgi:tetratricopeptide (TPR) repeat protein